MDTSVHSASAPAHPIDVPAAAAAGVWRAVVATGLLGVALIHLLDLPGKLDETPYLGWAYIAVIAASIALARLVARRPDPRAAVAAAALAACVLLGYVVNRTTGMPGAMDDVGNWTEPLGLASLFVEAVVAWAGIEAARAMQAFRGAPGRI